MSDNRKKTIEKNTPKMRVGTYKFDGERIGNTVTMSFTGVFAVSSFTSTDITLKMRCGSIEIFGNMLEITVYENKTIGVRGKIERVELK